MTTSSLKGPFHISHVFVSEKTIDGKIPSALEGEAGCVEERPVFRHTPHASFCVFSIRRKDIPVVSIDDLLYRHCFAKIINIVIDRKYC